MNDLRPVRLAKAWETMLGNSRMTDAIKLQQLPIDESVLRMDVENAIAELVDIHYRIDELTKQMAGVPLDADILAFRLVEEPLPHRWLREHVIAHNRQMI